MNPEKEFIDILIADFEQDIEIDDATMKSLARHNCSYISIETYQSRVRHHRFVIIKIKELYETWTLRKKKEYQKNKTLFGATNEF